MSLIVEWNGKAYDVDPGELSQRELDLIEQRTGQTWREVLVGALRPEPNAVRALFWVVDRRDEPDLRYSDYDGPPMKVWLPKLAEYREAVVEPLGKAITAAIPPSALGGSPSSPATADTPQPSTTP